MNILSTNTPSRDSGELDSIYSSNSTTYNRRSGLIPRSNSTSDLFEIPDGALAPIRHKVSIQHLHTTNNINNTYKRSTNKPSSETNIQNQLLMKSRRHSFQPHHHMERSPQMTNLSSTPNPTQPTGNANVGSPLKQAIYNPNYHHMTGTDIQNKRISQLQNKRPLQNYSQHSYQKQPQYPQQQQHYQPQVPPMQKQHRRKPSQQRRPNSHHAMHPIPEFTNKPQLRFNTGTTQNIKNIHSQVWQKQQQQKPNNEPKKKELTPYQLQKKQMKASFQFPNGESFTPRNQFPNSNIEIPPFTKQDSNVKENVSQIPESTRASNDISTKPVSNPSVIGRSKSMSHMTRDKTSDSTLFNQMEEPKLKRTNSQKLGSFFKKFLPRNNSSSSSLSTIRSGSPSRSPSPVKLENIKVEKKVQSETETVSESSVMFVPTLDPKRKLCDTDNNQKEPKSESKNANPSKDQAIISPPVRSPNRPALENNETAKLFYHSLDGSLSSTTMTDTESSKPNNLEVSDTLMIPEKTLKRLYQDWEKVTINKPKIKILTSTSVNSSTSSTSLPSSLNTGYSSATSSSTASKSLRFAKEITISETYSPFEYLRADPDTSTTKSLYGDNLVYLKGHGFINEIKFEINQYKRNEMSVHEMSNVNTHYFV